MSMDKVRQWMEMAGLSVPEEVVPFLQGQEDAKGKFQQGKGQSSDMGLLGRGQFSELGLLGKGQALGTGPLGKGLSLDTGVLGKGQSLDMGMLGTQPSTGQSSDMGILGAPPGKGQSLDMGMLGAPPGNGQLLGQPSDMGMLGAPPGKGQPLDMGLLGKGQPLGMLGHGTPLGTQGCKGQWDPSMGMQGCNGQWDASASMQGCNGQWDMSMAMQGCKGQWDMSSMGMAGCKGEFVDIQSGGPWEMSMAMQGKGQLMDMQGCNGQWDMSTGMLGCKGQFVDMGKGQRDMSMSMGMGMGVQGCKGQWDMSMDMQGGKGQCQGGFQGGQTGPGGFQIGGFGRQHAEMHRGGPGGFQIGGFGRDLSELQNQGSLVGGFQIGGFKEEYVQQGQSFAKDGGKVTTPACTEAKQGTSAAVSLVAAQAAQVAALQQATTGQPMSWQQLQMMQGRMPALDVNLPSEDKTSSATKGGEDDAEDGAAESSLGAPSANELTVVDSEQLEEYQRMVAALQLQYAAMGALGAEAAAAVGTQDLRAGPGGLLGAPVSGSSSSIKTAGSILSHDPHRRYTGTVFKWDDDAGWGFVSCIEARKVYGKDVFLHKAEIGGISDLYKQRTKVEVKNGDWVSFCVEISRGKPRARDVEKIDTPEEYRKGQQSLLEKEHGWSNAWRSENTWHSNDRDHWWGKRKREE